MELLQEKWDDDWGIGYISQLAWVHRRGIQDGAYEAIQDWWSHAFGVSKSFLGLACIRDVGEVLFEEKEKSNYFSSIWWVARYKQRRLASTRWMARRRYSVQTKLVVNLIEAKGSCTVFWVSIVQFETSNCESQWWFEARNSGYATDEANAINFQLVRSQCLLAPIRYHCDIL
jgi:hypothetical protein